LFFTAEARRRGERQVLPLMNADQRGSSQGCGKSAELGGRCVCARLVFLDLLRQLSCLLLFVRVEAFRRVSTKKIIIPGTLEFKSSWCIVLDMKSAGIVAVILAFLLAGCGGRTSSWSPNSIRLPITLRVSQGVMEGLRIRYLKPVYPGDPQKQGDVTLLFWVDKSGAVGNVRAINGDPILAEAAADAVKRWKYTPYILNGEPVEVETRTLVSFGK
jgi:TonB family protein